MFSMNQATVASGKRDFLLELFASGIPRIIQLIRFLPWLQILPSSETSRDHPLQPGIHWLISIFDSLHDGVLIADQNSIVRYINKSFERISGAVSSEIVGRS